MSEQLFRIQKVILTQVLLNRQVVPVLPSSDHTRIHHLITTTYRRHRHPLRISLHKLSIIDHRGIHSSLPSIRHTSHPTRRLRHLLRRFPPIRHPSSSPIQAPLRLNRHLLPNTASLAPLLLHRACTCTLPSAASCRCDRRLLLS